MKSKYVNGTINKDIYIHNDSNTEHRIDELEKEIVLKQDKLTAGENITISEDNVISSVGGGAEVFVIHIADGDASTITVTKEEVIAAIESNQPIVIDYEKTNTYGFPSTHYITAPVAVMTSQFLSHEYELEGRVANPVDSEYRFYSISFSDMADFSFNERFIQSVSTVNSESTNSQIPTAKAVYDAIIENSSDSIYETTVYYNDTATFDEHGEASLGECGIPLDISELKVTIDGTEHTLHRHNDGGYIWWSNDDGLEMWIENGDCYLGSTSISSQDCAVKVESRVLTQEFTNAVNDAVTYYDVYLDNQVITFNEQGVAELGSFNLNPEQTPKLLMTINGVQEIVYTWNGEVYVNEEDETIIGEEDGTWFLGPGAQGSICISLSSADVKSDFKDAVLSVSDGSQVEIFDVTYQSPKSDIYGLYTLMDDKTIDDVANAFYDGKPVYLMCRYGYTQIDQSVQPDRGETKYTPANDPSVTLWQVEYVHDTSGDTKGLEVSKYTIKTNVAQVYDKVDDVYKNIRLIHYVGNDQDNVFKGYEEEYGSSDVIFNLTSAAPKLNFEEPTTWYLDNGKTVADVYEAFASGKTVYLTYVYNSDIYRYIVTRANEYGNANNINIKGQQDHYTICAESFNGIDPDGNVQMKYLYAEYVTGGSTGSFTLYNKTLVDETSSEFSDIKQSVKSFVVFDGDLTFEEYTEDEDTFGRLVDPEEFDEIENAINKDVVKCPLLWDSVEMDGVPFEKSRTRSEWYEPDTWEHGDISIEGGHSTDAYLELRAPTAGVHHIRITASYGGTVKSAIVQPNYTYFLPRDVKTAFRRLNKTMIAVQSAIGEGFSIITDYYEEIYFNDDNDESTMYFVTVENYTYQSDSLLRFFTSGTGYPFRKINATLKWYAEDDSLYCNITPDQFISVITDGGIVNLSYIGTGDEAGTTYFAPSMPYRINYDEEHNIYQIVLLQPSMNWTGTLPYGITTNLLFDKSNEWYWEINPLNLNADDPTEPDVEIPPTPDPGIGTVDI